MVPKNTQIIIDTDLQSKEIHTLVQDFGDDSVCVLSHDIKKNKEMVIMRKQSLLMLIKILFNNLL